MNTLYAPSDSHWLYGTQAKAVAIGATAHNEGDTVLETKVEDGIVSLKMSSWPRAQEAFNAFLSCGWETRMGLNEMGQWIHVRSLT